MISLRERVAQHIDAKLGADGSMNCPACGGDFGPTIPVSTIAACYVDYLPGAPLLTGVCLDCGHITEPMPTTPEGGEQ